MKSIIATALVALGLLTTVVSAHAATDLTGYPDWAKQAFDENK